MPMYSQIDVMKQYARVARKTIAGPDADRDGFVAALLLLCLVDALGSYFFRAPRLSDGAGAGIVIDDDSHHFRVLCSAELFGAMCSAASAKDLYATYRNLLVHNATLPAGVEIDLGGATDPAVVADAGRVKLLRLVPLLSACEGALLVFERDYSHLLCSSPRADLLRRMFLAPSLAPGNSATASGVGPSGT